MSQSDENPCSSSSFDMQSESDLTPTSEPQDPAGPSIENLDQDFDFQIVVFEVFPVFKSSPHEETISRTFQKVENTLFKVLRNGFNVPGTTFEAIFAPQTTDTSTSSIEGNSLENPIRLPGVKVDHFRSFLRILYPLCVLMILSVKYSRV
jgi:hypothetical protein